LDLLSPPAAADEVFEQSLVELHARVERHVIDPRLKAFLLVERAEAVDFAFVILPVSA
jgi:hypothetical protein